MNVNVQKYLIAAIVALHMCCGTYAAAIGPEVVAVGGDEVDLEVEDVEAEVTLDETAPQVGNETAVATADVKFKCGDLVCPNGVFCEIKEIPSSDEKKITVTTICKDADGKILDEKTTTEDVPEGEIPFTSVKKKVIKTDEKGGFFGSSSYAGSYSHGSVGPIFCGNHGDNDAEMLTEFSFDDDEKRRSVGSVFDEIMSAERKILQRTSDVMHSIFESWW